MNHGYQAPKSYAKSPYKVLPVGIVPQTYDELIKAIQKKQYQTSQSPCHNRILKQALRTPDQYEQSSLPDKELERYTGHLANGGHNSIFISTEPHPTNNIVAYGLCPPNKTIQPPAPQDWKKFRPIDPNDGPESLDGIDSNPGSVRSLETGISSNNHPSESTSSIPSAGDETRQINSDFCRTVSNNPHDFLRPTRKDDVSQSSGKMVGNNLNGSTHYSPSYKSQYGHLNGWSGDRYETLKRKSEFNNGSIANEPPYSKNSDLSAVGRGCDIYSGGDQRCSVRDFTAKICQEPSSLQSSCIYHLPYLTPIQFRKHDSILELDVSHDYSCSPPKVQQVSEDSQKFGKFGSRDSVIYDTLSKNVRGSSIANHRFDRTEDDATHYGGANKYSEGIYPSKSSVPSKSSDTSSSNQGPRWSSDMPTKASLTNGPNNASDITTRDVSREGANTLSDPQEFPLYLNQTLREYSERIASHNSNTNDNVPDPKMCSGLEPSSIQNSFYITNHNHHHNDMYGRTVTPCERSFIRTVPGNCSRPKSVWRSTSDLLNDTCIKDDKRTPYLGSPMVNNVTECVADPGAYYCNSPFSTLQRRKGVNGPESGPFRATLRPPTFRATAAIKPNVWSPISTKQTPRFNPHPSHPSVNREDLSYGMKHPTHTIYNHHSKDVASKDQNNRPREQPYSHVITRDGNENIHRPDSKFEEKHCPSPVPKIYETNYTHSPRILTGQFGTEMVTDRKNGSGEVEEDKMWKDKFTRTRQNFENRTESTMHISDPCAAPSEKNSIIRLKSEGGNSGPTRPRGGPPLVTCMSDGAKKNVHVIYRSDSGDGRKGNGSLLKVAPAPGKYDGSEGEYVPGGRDGKGSKEISHYGNLSESSEQKNGMDIAFRDNGGEGGGGYWSTLPRTQSPTITLLRKRRESLPTSSPIHELRHHIRAEADDNGSDSTNRPTGSTNTHTVPYRLNSVLTKYPTTNPRSSFEPTEPGKLKRTSSRPLIYEDGIGPVTENGIPTATKPAIRSDKQHDWYRTIFKNLNPSTTRDSMHDKISSLKKQDQDEKYFSEGEVAHRRKTDEGARRKLFDRTYYYNNNGQNQRPSVSKAKVVSNGSARYYDGPDNGSDTYFRYKHYPAEVNGSSLNRPKVALKSRLESETDRLLADYLAGSAKSSDRVGPVLPVRTVYYDEDEGKPWHFKDPKSQDASNRRPNDSSNGNKHSPEPAVLPKSKTFPGITNNGDDGHRTMKDDHPKESDSHQTNSRHWTSKFDKEDYSDRSALDPDSVHEWYTNVQKGGEVPYAGLQKVHRANGRDSSHLGRATPRGPCGNNSGHLDMDGDSINTNGGSRSTSDIYKPTESIFNNRDDGSCWDRRNGRDQSPASILGGGRDDMKADYRSRRNQMDEWIEHEKMRKSREEVKKLEDRRHGYVPSSNSPIPVNRYMNLVYTAGPDEPASKNFTNSRILQDSTSLRNLNGYSSSSDQKRSSTSDRKINNGFSHSPDPYNNNNNDDNNSYVNHHRPSDAGLPNGRRRYSVSGGTRQPATIRAKARALYRFVAKNSKEISFDKDDVVYLLRRVDPNWFEGEHVGMIGIFPANYVKVLISIEEAALLNAQHGMGVAIAKYNCNSQYPSEISFRKGEVLTLTSELDRNWYEGKVGDKGPIGMIPKTYVEILREPLRDGHFSEFNNHKNGDKFTNGFRSLSVSDSLRTGNGSSPKLTRYRALYSYKPQNDDELELTQGDIVYVMERCEDGWYVGYQAKSKVFGTFPGNYVELD